LGSAVNGVKAGAVAGVIYGIVLGILSYITVISEKTVIIASITKSLPSNSPFTPTQLYGIVVLLTPVVAAIGGVIGGIIVGAIYGRLFERIPGGSSIIKAVVVGVALWLILSVLGGIGNLQYGVETYLSGVAVGLGSALLFGFLLGYFYGRFVRPKETYELKEDVGALKGNENRSDLS
jgi:hypothetical protein